MRGARNGRLASTLKRLSVAGACTSLDYHTGTLCSESRYDGGHGDAGWTQQKALKLSAS